MPPKVSEVMAAIKSEMNAQINAQKDREAIAVEQAKREGRRIVYVDDDGCEVTATPLGAVFYNAADWY